MGIRAYHQSRGDHHRDVCIIPVSAHGTNPASAAMCGMKIVVVGTDADGNINIPELTAAAEKHSDNLAALMVTYPSTHGVYEDGIKQAWASGFKKFARHHVLKSSVFFSFFFFSFSFYKPFTTNEKHVC